MATPNSSTYQVKIQALWDNTKIKLGSNEAEAAIKSLADEFDTTTDQIRSDLNSLDSALSTDLTGSFKRTASDVEAEGGKLKATGREIGGEFAENIGEAFRSGDVGGAITETFTSLGPALGLAGVAIGAGAAVVTGLVKGMQAEREKIRQAGIAAFEAFQDGIADRTERYNILNQILGTETIPDTLVKLRKIAAETGLTFEVVRNALLGNAAAGAKVAAAYGAADQTARGIQQTGKGVTAVVDNQSSALRSLVDSLYAVNGALNQGAKDARDSGLVKQSQELAANYGAAAAALERADAAARSLAGRRLPPMAVYE